MEKIEKCIICENKTLTKIFECKDELCSKDFFNIEKCNNCGMIYTNPRPYEKEIKYYYISDNYISHNHGKNDIISKIYELIRNKSIKRKHLIINKYFQQGNILDIGCGIGLFLNYFRKKRWNSFGVEPNEKAREIAKNNYNIPIFEKLEEIENKDNKYEVITMWHSLEHIYRIDETLKKIVSLLAKDGILVIAIPNNQAYDSVKYKEKWAAWDVPRHIYHFNNQTITALLEKYNMILIEKVPLLYDAYYISLQSEDKSKGIIKLFRAFIIGFLSNIYAKKYCNYSSVIYIFKKQKNKF